MDVLRSWIILQPPSTFEELWMLEAVDITSACVVDRKPVNKGWMDGLSKVVALFQGRCFTYTMQQEEEDINRIQHNILRTTRKQV